MPKEDLRTQAIPQQVKYSTTLTEISCFHRVMSFVIYMYARVRSSNKCILLFFFVLTFLFTKSKILLSSVCVCVCLSLSLSACLSVSMYVSMSLSRVSDLRLYCFKLPICLQSKRVEGMFFGTETISVGDETNKGENRGELNHIWPETCTTFHPLAFVTPIWHW